MATLEHTYDGREIEAPSLTVQEAFAAILLGAVNADGHVSSDEGTRVYQVLKSMNLYLGLSAEALQAIVGKMMEWIEYHGVAAVVAWAARAIPPELRTTAFANAVDLVLSDRGVKRHERDFITELQTVLQLDDATALDIVHVMTAKNRG
jgi:uncharacterized tellurite resistance protein B-like protein